MDAPGLHLRMAGSPIAVYADRVSITDDDWDEISLLLADDQVRPGESMVVRPEALITHRGDLRSLLKRHGIRMVADDAVKRLLEQTLADDTALSVALNATKEEINHEQCAAPDLGSRKLTRDLRPFQSRDLAVLRRLPHGANFSVPGAGKTTVSYVLHLEQRAQEIVDRLLVIAPLSAFGAWEEEAEAVIDPPLSVARWRGGALPNVDVILINYQRIPAAVDQLSSWMGRCRVHLVVDEAHRAKRGAAGGWGRALLRLAPLAARRDILTGTPAPNHPRDLAALLDILWPSGRASAALPRQTFQQDPPLRAMAEVASAIRTLYVRTTKEELQLPKVDIRSVPVRLGRLQQAIYDAMLNRYAGMFDLDRRDSLMFSQMGEVTMYLLQAASSPRLLSDADPDRAYRYPSLAIPPNSKLAALVDSYGEHEVPNKIAHACAIVNDNARQARKTLVWSNFPRNLLALERQLAALSPAVIYGSVPTDDDAPPGMRTRERELQRFREDPACQVLLANPAAMSEGVSLHHACNDAIYVDRTFNAGQYLQSLDRIHRLGLKPGTETRVSLLVAAGTIDERVHRRVEVKTRRLARMLSDPGLIQMALPDDEEIGEPLDHPDDLEEILHHLGEAPRPEPADEF